MSLIASNLQVVMANNIANNLNCSPTVRVRTANEQLFFVRHFCSCKPRRNNTFALWANKRTRKRTHPPYPQ